MKKLNEIPWEVKIMKHITSQEYYWKALPVEDGTALESILGRRFYPNEVELKSDFELFAKANGITNYTFAS